MAFIAIADEIKKTVRDRKAQKNRQLAIFTGACPTIFAVAVLDFCVRDGNRYFHCAIVTGFNVVRDHSLKTE